MGQVLHGSARTTAAVRRAIQDSQESLRVLARRHGINPKTVAKWRQRRTLDDRKTGPKEPRSTVPRSRPRLSGSTHCSRPVPRLRLPILPRSRHFGTPLASLAQRVQAS